MQLPGLRTPAQRGYREPASGGQGGSFWRAFASFLLAGGTIVLLSTTLTSPSKRIIEVVAGIVFLCFIVATHPIRAYYLALAMLPFHVSLSVGTTTNLLIFVVGAAVLAKAKSMRLDPPFRDSRLNMFIFGWVITMMLSFAKMPSSDMARALIDFQSFIAALVLVYTMTRLVRSPQHLHNMLRTLQFAILVTAVIAILQSSFPERRWLPTIFSYEAQMAQMDMELEAGKVRAFATFAGYEFFAEYMAISIIMQFVLMRMASSVRERLLWGFGTGACLIALVASATRGPILALAVAIVWMVIGGRGAIPRRHVIVLIFGGLVLLQIAALSAPHLLEQMLDRMSEDLTKADSMSSREVAWRQAIEAIAKSPLLGHGLAIPMGTWKGGVAMNLHSLYLHLAYTIGIPGLLLFMGIIVRLFQISLRAARDRSQTPFIRHVMMGLNACLVLFLIDQLKIEYSRAPIEITLIWVLFAFLLSAEKLARQARMNAGPDQNLSLEWVPAER